jgi:hypothetical protein
MRYIKNEEKNYDLRKPGKYGTDSSLRSYSHTKASALGSQTFRVGLHPFNEFHFFKLKRESYLQNSTSISDLRFSCR